MDVKDVGLAHQLDAEQAVLGSMLIDARIVPRVLAAVKLEDFASQTNQLIYKAARKLHQTGKSVDAVTIRDQVGESYTSYLMQLMEITPTSANWQEYADLMHQQATVNRLRLLADKLSACQTLEDCRPVLADMDQLAATGRKTESWTMRDMMEDFLDSQDPSRPDPEYIRTGYPFLDNGIFLRPGSFVILGGYPSSGKTALGLSMAYHMGKERKVGFFSLETDKEQVRDRLVTASAHLDMGKIQSRNLDDKDWEAVASISGDFSQRTIITIPAAGMGVSEIEAITTAYDFSVIFVDYVQLIEPFSRRVNRSEQMQAVSQALHVFAQKSGVTVIALAQLSRPERGKGKAQEPSMHDIKESGQFEQDADLILILHEPLPGDDAEGNRVLKVAKNKQGRRGRWHLAFDGATQSFQLASANVQARYVRAGEIQRTRNHLERSKLQELEEEQTEIDRIFPPGEPM